MKLSGQGQGHRGKKIGYFGSFLRICSNSSYSFAWIWLLSHRNVQKGHTKNVRSRNFEFLPESIFIEGQRSKMDTFDGNVKKTFFFYASNVMRGLSKVE